MGERGPAGKRSDQRRRRNKPATPVETVDASDEVEVPRSKASWHPVAKRWFESLGKSPQSRYYTAADWGLAYATAETLSRDMKPQPVGVDKDGEPVLVELPMKGTTLAAFLKACSQLLVGEADRRRLGIEVTVAPASDDPDVPNIDDYRARAV